MKDEFEASLSSKINNLNNNESLLILQKYQNAKMFDIGILEKKMIYLISILSKLQLKKIQMKESL